LWADASIKLKEYDSIEKNISTQIKNKHFKKIAVLPIKYLGKNNAVEINHLNDVISVYVYKTGVTDLYERSNLKDLFEEVTLAKKGLSKSEAEINLIPVEAFLGGYYYFNRDDDIDLGIELIDVYTSQIIWSEKIYINNSEYASYEYKLLDYSEYLSAALTKKAANMKNIVFTGKNSIVSSEDILKKVFEKDLTRLLVKKQKWVILDRDYLSEIKKEWKLNVQDNTQDNLITENMKHIGELTQADGMLSVDVINYIGNLNTDQEINIFTKLYLLDSAEIIGLVEFSIMDRFIPLGLLNKPNIIFSMLPMRTAYWYLKSHSGSFSQNQTITPITSGTNTGYGLGAMQFIYSYPKDTINTVLFANIDLNSGFGYKDSTNQDVTLINTSASLEWGLQFFDSYTITGGFGVGHGFHGGEGFR
jgi:hypothetical protein